MKNPAKASFEATNRPVAEYREGSTSDFIKPYTPYQSKIGAESFLRELGYPDKSASNKPIKLPASERGRIYTLGELWERPRTKTPQLVAPLLQHQGLAMLVGSSDVGKSAFLRQLAMSIAAGAPDFIGFPIHAKHRRALCVCTEDDADELEKLLQKQLPDQQARLEAKDRLLFLFDPEHLLLRLDEELTANPVDLVVIDALADIFEGNLNQSNEVRGFLQQYGVLAAKHGCLILFMHHTGKRAEERSPSKNNVLGSQGLEAKMRVVLELRADPTKPDIRHLCVLKGNYLGPDIKGKSFALRFDENLLFHNTGQREDFTVLIAAPEQNAAEREFWSIAKDLLEAGISYDQAAQQLLPIAKKLNLRPVSKATLYRRWPKSSLNLTPPPSQSLTGESEVRLTAEADAQQPCFTFTADAVKCLFVGSNVLTTDQLLIAIHSQYSGDTSALMNQLIAENCIEPAPSGKGLWRIANTAP